MALTKGSMKAAVIASISIVRLIQIGTGSDRTIENSDECRVL
jgi:hypothetical protein